MLHGAELFLAVGKSVLALYEHHRCGYHVCAELGIMTCTGMNILMLDTSLLSGCLDVADELLIIVNCVAVPCLDNLTGTACPGLFSAALDDIQNLSFEQFGDYPAISNAMTAGTVDAFCVDKSILATYKTDDRDYITDTFSPQEYGVATKKDSPLSSKIDELIKGWLEDGTIDGLITEFGLN